MTNNQLTKEWLQQTIAELESVRDEIPFGIDTNSELELAAFKMALAAMDSEPVAYAWVSRNGKKHLTRCEPEQWRDAVILTPLYRHAQPAPEKYNIGDATMRHIFTPTGMTNISDLQAVFDRVEVVLSSMESEHVVTITDAMAYAFHHALTDGPLGDDDVEDIKTGLRAAFATVTIKQPEPVVPVEATIDNKPNSSYEWRKGWNACLAAMLAVAPPAPKSTVK
ncbi:hypothetical protein [Klebsiella aerogenes]|uniref:hypothetical protein n=1 Tax=Klebsiella aerogenes TaxID=548 RepID=UPI003A9871C8